MKNIRNNKDLFDDQELPEGHFERFEALLNKQDIEKKPVRRSVIITMLSVAASLIILVIGGYHIYSSGISMTNMETDASFSEFSMTSKFYRQQMEEQITNIMCKLENADTETRNELERDIERLVSENDIFIEKIEKNDEELAIYYMVEHYKTNIEVLEFINKKLGNYINC